MKKFVFLISVCCLVLGVQPAMAKDTPPAKHAVAKKKSEKAPPRQESTPGETVETPGRVIKEPNAFNGIKWGTGLAAIPDLTVAERDGQAAYATAEGVVYRIGDAFLSGVVYGFCQDKFAAVMVEYKGRKNHESIKNFLMTKYSKPIDLEGHGNDLGWPVGNVLIRMNYSPNTDSGTLSYFYQPLYGPCGEAKAPQ
ncbi:Peptidoglycan-binding LysM [Desulfovibrio sp. DV]|uniref:hypothetical protein n=1 Tax=Desulfovibrio sp. DV TaxID=1844708 RepID=UPI00094B9994|nr:hypothetical protein [Desulfovibrio sp. DV]OLN26596.1 Peptidoglycan-binding LysM [Desulfovibrio sp. DV]